MRAKFDIFNNEDHGKTDQLLESCPSGHSRNCNFLLLQIELTSEKSLYALRIFPGFTRPKSCERHQKQTKTDQTAAKTTTWRWKCFFI